MQANKSRDTRPEVAMRSRLHRDGLRFRKHVRPVADVRCVADIVFPAIEIGCFFRRMLVARMSVTRLGAENQPRMVDT